METTSAWAGPPRRVDGEAHGEDEAYAAHDEAVAADAGRLDVPSWVLDDSTGYWRVEPVRDRPGAVRVWFCVAVKLKPLVPRFVVGLVSRLGLRKATKWLKDLEPARGGNDSA